MSNRQKRRSRRPARRTPTPGITSLMKLTIGDILRMVADVALPPGLDEVDDIDVDLLLSASDGLVAMVPPAPWSAASMPALRNSFAAASHVESLVRFAIPVVTGDAADLPDEGDDAFGGGTVDEDRTTAVDVVAGAVPSGPADAAWSVAGDGAVDDAVDGEGDLPFPLGTGAFPAIAQQWPGPNPYAHAAYLQATFHSAMAEELPTAGMFWVGAGLGELAAATVDTLPEWTPREVFAGSGLLLWADPLTAQPDGFGMVGAAWHTNERGETVVLTLSAEPVGSSVRLTAHAGWWLLEDRVGPASSDMGRLLRLCAATLLLADNFSAVKADTVQGDKSGPGMFRGWSHTVTQWDAEPGVSGRWHQQPCGPGGEHRKPRWVTAPKTTTGGGACIVTTADSCTG